MPVFPLVPVVSAQGYPCLILIVGPLVVQALLGLSVHVDFPIEIIGGRIWEIHEAFAGIWPGCLNCLRRIHFISRLVVEEAGVGTYILVCLMYITSPCTDSIVT